MNSQEIFKIDWIEVDKLAIGALPKNNNDIQKLKNKNIKSILSLCEFEMVSIQDQLKKNFHYRNIILPDHKKGILPTLEQLIISIEAIDKLTLFGSTYVHCFASMERSPLVCMAWIIKEHHLKPQEALDYVMQAHSGTCPLSGQLALLNKIFEIYKNKSNKRF